MNHELMKNEIIKSLSLNIYTGPDQTFLNTTLVESFKLSPPSLHPQIN